MGGIRPKRGWSWLISDLGDIGTHHGPEPGTEVSNHGGPRAMKSGSMDRGGGGDDDDSWWISGGLDRLVPFPTLSSPRERKNITGFAAGDSAACIVTL